MTSDKERDEMIGLVPNKRYSFSAINDRKAFSWPDGKRLAVYIGLNLEHFSFGKGLGVQLVPSQGMNPDILNYSWRDYGNRVGAWRLHTLFESFEIPVSLLVNTSIYDYCPSILEPFRERGAEIIAHGRTNSERQGDLSETEESQLILETTQRIFKEEGAVPSGWLGPWISETYQTPDLLSEHGYRYLLDWCHDDQPTWLETKRGGILSLPYPQELNDIPTIIIRKASAKEFSQMITDNFDEMLLQSKDQPLVMGIALHSYIVGQPFRLKHLREALRHIVNKRKEIWVTTAGEIANYTLNSLQKVNSKYNFEQCDIV